MAKKKDSNNFSLTGKNLVASKNVKSNFLKKNKNKLLLFFSILISFSLLLFANQTLEDKEEREIKVDVLVIGGSLGGTSAAIEASNAGSSVILVEELDWLGGQISSQGVSAMDAAPHIYTRTGTYGKLVQKIKEYYGLTLEQKGPGNSTVGDPSFEPIVGAKIIEDMTRESGVRIFKEHKITSVKREGNRIKEVKIKSLKNGKEKQFFQKL